MTSVGVFATATTHLAARRGDFADELHVLVRRVPVAQTLAAARFLELMRA